MTAGSPTFAGLLRHFLDERKLPITTAAELWHLNPDGLHRILRGSVAPPRTKVGLWADLLEQPEEVILAAANRSRALLGRAPFPERAPVSAHAPVAKRRRAAAADEEHAAESAPEGVA